MIMSEDIFYCHNWEVFLASSGYRLRMLLKFYNAQDSLTTKNYLVKNIKSATVEKP